MSRLKQHNTPVRKFNILVKSLLAAGAIGAISMSAAADNYNYPDNETFDYARVVSSEPIYETYQVNNPVQQCWNERVPVSRSYKRNRGYDSKTPEVVGAIIGGAVGNQVGKRGGGKARDVATVVGAVLGGSIARDVKNNRRHQNQRYSRTEYENVQRCETRDSYTSKRELVGYDVAYRYQGNVYHTQMADHPGNKIRVKVTVDPV